MGDILLETNDLVAVSQTDERVIVRFTSPSTRNPLSWVVLALLEQIVSQCETTSPTSELIVTGTDDVFASGANLKEIAQLTPNSATEFGLRGQSLMNRIAGLEMKTTAAINGYCFGGALDLALACDRRIATSNASLCHPGVGLGIITGWGGTQRLSRLIGAAFANEIFFTAEPMTAERALAIGLIDAIDNAFIQQLL
jgi:enoyl-CoA hydratase